MEVRKTVDGALEVAFCFWNFGREMGRSVRPAVDAMQHDVLNCQSNSNPEPHDIVVHGGNGFCGPASSYLAYRLGRGYRVEAKPGGDVYLEEGRYYLDVDWYQEQVSNGGRRDGH